MKARSMYIKANITNEIFLEKAHHIYIYRLGIGPIFSRNAQCQNINANVKVNVFEEIT